MPEEWTPASLLAWWFGEPDRTMRLPEVDLPPALLDLHAALSGYSALPLTWQNRLLSPDEVRADGGMLVFWVEAQGVSSWATDGEEVFEQASGSDTWLLTELSLEEFCLALLVFEIAVSSEHTVMAEVAEDELDFALEGFADFPAPGPLVDSDLYVAEDAVVFAADGWLCLAARGAATLARYERRI